MNLESEIHVDVYPLQTTVDPTRQLHQVPSAAGWPEAMWFPKLAQDVDVWYLVNCFGPRCCTIQADKKPLYILSLPVDLAGLTFALIDGRHCVGTLPDVQREACTQVTVFLAHNQTGTTP
jgi:hypothetical protein